MVVIVLVSLGCYLLFDGPICNLLEYLIFGIKKIQVVDNKTEYNVLKRLFKGEIKKVPDQGVDQ